jgi:hypothetical protein
VCVFADRVGRRTRSVQIPGVFTQRVGFDLHGEGRLFSQQHIRKMLLSPAYAELRNIKKMDGSVSYVDGQWEHRQ